MQKRIPVILDTDIGTDIDDTWALLMLLGSPELDLKLIVTSCGDTRYRAHLTAKILQIAGRADIPIGIGIEDTKNEQYDLRFQQPWIEDFDVGNYSGIIYENGVKTMLDFINDSNEPITIICIGATTNIAHALEIQSDITKKCRFVGMHGSVYFGLEGNPGPIAETNVRLDVDSFKEVLCAPWLEKVITPVDTCGIVKLEKDRFLAIKYSTNPLLIALMKNYEIWSQLVTWFKVDYFDTRSSCLFDTVAIFLAYSKDFLEIQQIGIVVDQDGVFHVDPGGELIQVALNWLDMESFCDHLVNRLQNSFRHLNSH
jgi:inosine-uridine nucleoside N-ribohydrolase